MDSSAPRHQRRVAQLYVLPPGRIPPWGNPRGPASAPSQRPGRNSHGRHGQGRNRASPARDSGARAPRASWRRALRQRTSGEGRATSRALGYPRDAAQTNGKRARCALPTRPLSVSPASCSASQSPQSLAVVRSRRRLPRRCRTVVAAGHSSSVWLLACLRITGRTRSGCHRLG